MQVLNDFNTTVQKALSEIDPKWRDYKGLVICGTHTPLNTEYMIDQIHEARINGTPFLGICFGHQLAAIEYARYELGIKDATSEEFSTEGTFVVVKRPELKVGLHDGESWWSNYEVNFVPVFPANFFTVPYHPEYQSSKENPHPLLVSFLKYAMAV
jgi:CTP synthase (UTP-ammonia lyase)